MWTVNFVDGGSLHEQDGISWMDLPSSRKISAVKLAHPHVENLSVCLTNYEKFYFSREALALVELAEPKGTVVAEIIGAHDLKLGVGVEARLEYSGDIKIFCYPLNHFKYSLDILRDGRGNHSPTCEVEGASNSNTSNL